MSQLNESGARSTAAWNSASPSTQSGRRTCSATSAPIAQVASAPALARFSGIAAATLVATPTIGKYMYRSPIVANT